MSIVVARMPEHMDLFLSGSDGIYSIWWDQNINNGQWNGWFREAPFIGPPTGGVPTAVFPTVIARMAEHLDVFAVGKDGGIYSTWWDSSSGWANWFRIGNLNASSEKDFPPARVAALARMPEQLDLFTESGGGIYSAAWNSSSGWTNWFRIDGGGGTGTVGPVFAVTRMPQHLDLFSFDLQGNIYNSRWDISSGWSAWSVIAGTFF